MRIPRTSLLIGALLLCLYAAGSASALTYDGRWDASSGSIFAVQTSFFPSNSSLYIYDLGNTADRLLVMNDQFLAQGTIYFSNINNNWFAGRTVGGQDLYLGASPDFGFLFMHGDNIYTSYDLSTLVANSAYELRTADMDVIFTDSKPVPEPATLLLLGAGLIMLAFIGRRKMSGTNN